MSVSEREGVSDHPALTEDPIPRSPSPLPPPPSPIAGTLQFTTSTPAYLNPLPYLFEAPDANYVMGLLISGKTH